MKRGETQIELSWPNAAPSEAHFEELAVAAAPLFAALLGSAARPVRLSWSPSALTLATDAVLGADAGCVIPIVIGSAEALLAAAARAAIPDWVLRFPSLVNRTDRHLVLTLPRRATRLSMIEARTPLDERLKITLQQALSMTFLFAESRIAELLPEPRLEDARRAVEGEIGLAMDRS